ncbi:MAG TPA: hypothetical protein VGL59_20910 [Polyangia bacterium]|jgi:hypothetical protein
MGLSTSREFQLVSDAEALAYSAEHLWYELLMLRWAIRQQPWDRQAANARLECFAIHARNLIDFLYPPENPKKKDVIFADFLKGSGWEPEAPSAELTRARNMAHKQIAHLTTGRIAGSGHADKAWHLTEVTRDIETVLRKFSANASPERLAKKFVDLLG